MSEGDSFTRSGEDGTRGLGGWGIVSHAQERRHPALRRGRRGGFGLGDSGAKKYILENYPKMEFKSMIQVL